MKFRYLDKNKWLLFAMLVLVSACKKGLDYQNLNAINPTNVWSDSTLIKAYLNDIYGGLMPGWPIGDGASSDESINGSGVNLGSYQQGILDVSSTYSNLSYTYIDKANYFIDQLASVPETVLPINLKDRLIGEAKFWRAWAYWSMVSKIGGVPLILHTQTADASKTSSLHVPRNKTSECVAQVIKDLDSAAMILPPNYDGVDYGRINSVAALGFKARVLLWYASPLFNPTNDASRWQTAYTAAKAALTAADAAGFGLLPNYRNIWYSGNKEEIMVNQYYYPDHYMNFAPIRPIASTNGATNTDQPILPLLLAYPKRDGSPMQFDKTQLADPVYNAQFLTDFYTNRDDRFYATIWLPGTPYPTPDVRNHTYWAAWKWNPGATPSSELAYKDGSFIGISDQNAETGFYERKGLDTTLNAADLVGVAAGAKSWFSPMRYAELLLNFGECANETGNTAEALDALYRIRQRAGIESGAGANYGITATSKSDIRNAYINERQVEFAFENFRFNDLRRWKRFDILNTEGTRRGVLLMLNQGAPLPALSDNIMSASVRADFSAVIIDNLDKSPSADQKFDLSLNHWFYALNPAQISIEPDVLQQNNEWGGSFDPLQ